MDRSSSQCTSESGWTLYLDPSTTTTLYQNQQHQHHHGDYRALKSVYDQEEDMSMVSDASSGPPNCHEDYDQDSFYGNGCHHCSASASDLAHAKKMKKSKSTDQSVTKQRRSCLEDTASSPVFSFSKNMNFSNKKPSMEHVSSEGFSATHFKGKSTLQKNFGFFKAEK